MDPPTSIDSSLFCALQSLNLDRLSDKDVSHALPFLVRLLLNPHFTRRKQIFKLIYRLRKANDIIQLLRLDPIEPHEIAQSPPIENFERSSPHDRLRIVAHEYLQIQEKIRKINPNVKFQSSTLFDCLLYIDDISYCLFALLNDQISIPFNIMDMCETLLHVKFGAIYIVRLVANSPDLCQEVCYSMINFGERFDEGANFSEVSDQRSRTLRVLCSMNPNIAFLVRSLTIQLHKVPSLAITVTLDKLNQSMDLYEARLEEIMTDDGDESTTIESVMLANEYKDLEETFDNAIAFITGVLLAVDEETRNWFSQYLKSAQQKRIDQSHFSVLSKFRSRILGYVHKLFPGLSEQHNHDISVDGWSNKRLVRGIAIMRFYCALRGIGTLKLNHDESETLLSIVTTRQSHNKISINYVDTGICTLLTCPSMINNPKDEKRATDWLKWLMKSSDFKPDRSENPSSSLLMSLAHRFHNNQLSQAAEIVCSTLNMKLQIKASISRCKSLFVQDFFEEQLADNSDGESQDKSHEDINMPIHCMYQLLESVESKSIELLGSSTSAFLGVTINGTHHIKLSGSMKVDLNQQMSENFKTIQEDPLKLVRTINNILILPDDEIESIVDIFIENWIKILSLSSSPEHRKLTQLATKLWRKLNSISPRKLWVNTVNSMRKSQNMKLALAYTWDELVQDPLIVLRCDNRVFRCPDVLEILLLVLDAFLAASKRCLQEQIDKQSPKKEDMRNLEELKTTLVLAQTSAAVQILLEFCSPTEQEQDLLDKKSDGKELSGDEKPILDRLDASVDCICEHLHQMFIADTNLAKLVHFQTYPSELLATTCDRIPSMHICLDFIPELIAQPDLSKQVFVVELTSHLCEKYAITKSLNAAKLCTNAAYTLLQLLPSEKRALFFMPVLPALLRICKVFPILQEDARIILNQIDSITLAHMASTSSRLSLGSAKPFEGLDKMIWRDIKILMQSLSLNEALYLCIQKCLLDLPNVDVQSDNSTTN